MPTKEQALQAARFAPDAQTDAAWVRHYAEAFFNFTSNNSYILTRIAFTPNIPATITVIPLIEIFVRHWYNKDNQPNHREEGWGSSSGSPFGGTTVAVGVYKDASIGNEFRLYGNTQSQANSGWAYFSIVASLHS